jgi:site-specific DNA-methyltransferase (adenine-specific)
MWQVLTGNNTYHLRQFPDNHFDSIVTDPPYGIDFLGQAWDANTGALETYQECLRVLKPGGYILAFSAARTYHHLAVTIEQAGFEIRDQIMWIYSQAMPKGNNLKPGHEPIVMACRGRPNQLNIDACRIPVTQETRSGGANGFSRLGFGQTVDKTDGRQYTPSALGRYPHNVLGEIPNHQCYYYCPKANRTERGADNTHPTVKPIELMKYLIQLVTPPGGHVLDPFNGSGSTGCAAVELNMDYTGIELDPAYVEIARKRIAAWHEATHSNKFAELFE